MAAHEPSAGMITGPLIAIDGVAGAALERAARARAGVRRTRAKPGISRWDASGLFEQLALGEAGVGAGVPTARTLLLLYAADLAFRLRWEIEPAIESGRTVVAVPYIDTAIAFGVAAELPAEWLRDLFSFAPTPAERQVAAGTTPRGAAPRDGFIQFASRHGNLVVPARTIARRAGEYLRAMVS